MAQEFVHQAHREKAARFQQFKNENVTVDAAAAGTTLFEMDVAGCERLFARVRNTHATVAFDACVVEAKATDDADDDWVDVTAETDIVLNAVSTTLAALTTAFLLLNVRGLYKVRLRASANTNPGTANVHGSIH